MFQYKKEGMMTKNSSGPVPAHRSRECHDEAQEKNMSVQKGGHDG